MTAAPADKLSGSAPWFRSVADAYGLPPENYFVFDVETTGLSTEQDMITQIGYCEVRGRQAVAKGSVILNWTTSPGMDAAWFRTRLETCERQMAARGSNCKITYKRVIEEGYDPREMLEGIVSMLREAVARGDALIGHNVWHFDIPLLERHFSMYINDQFKFPDGAVWDTGMLEKGRQIAILPRRGMSMRNFCSLVYNTRAKVPWSLDRHCVPTYNLVEKHAFDTNDAHDAGADCLMTHYLFEAQRELMDSKC